MPGNAEMKSVCQDFRRFSPSVMDLRPVASCFLIRASISRSSIAFSCSGEISPRSRLARASFSAAERKQAADMVGAEGRLGTLHCCSLFNFDRHPGEAAGHRRHLTGHR